MIHQIQEMTGNQVFLMWVEDTKLSVSYGKN